MRVDGEIVDVGEIVCATILFIGPETIFRSEIDRR